MNRNTEKNQTTHVFANIGIILGAYALMGIGYYIYDTMSTTPEVVWEWSSEFIIIFLFVWILLINAGPIIWCVKDSPNYIISLLFAFASVPVALLLFYIAQMLNLPFLELVVLNLGVIIHFIKTKVVKKK